MHFKCVHNVLECIIETGFIESLIFIGLFPSDENKNRYIFHKQQTFLTVSLAVNAQYIVLRWADLAQSNFASLTSHCSKCIPSELFIIIWAKSCCATSYHFPSGKRLFHASLFVVRLLQLCHNNLSVSAEWANWAPSSGVHFQPVARATEARRFLLLWLQAF